MASTRQKVHEPPHLTARKLVLVWLALLALTALTVGISSLQLGRLSLAAALLIAGVKSGLVAAWFMHLRYERVRLYLVLLIITLVLVGILLWLTWADIGPRYEAG